MKYLIILSMTFLIFNKVHAAFIRQLDSDAFADEEKAAETAKIINQNFSELANTKTNRAGENFGEVRYFVNDLLNPEEAENNAFYIMENADDLWRSKESFDGINDDSGRTIQLADILDDPEQTVASINQIFYELDVAKKEP